MSDETTTAPETIEVNAEPTPTEQSTEPVVPKAPRAPKSAKPAASAKKQTIKKPSTPKSKEKTVSATTATKKPAAKTDPAKDKDREAAKAAGLNFVHYRVLRALVKAGRPLSYRGIEKVTGYYSTLTKIMRDDYDGSLCSLGLTKEEVDDDDTLVFVATAKGRKMFDK